MAVILALWRLRQEVNEFEASLDYIEKPGFKKQNQRLVIATDPDNLSSIPWTHMVEENWLLHVVL